VDALFIINRRMARYERGVFNTSAFVLRSDFNTESDNSFNVLDFFDLNSE